MEKSTVKNILLFVGAIIIAVLSTAFVYSVEPEAPAPIYGIENAVDAPRYFVEPTDLMRDYQLKISEDMQYLIVYDGIRKVGVIPYRKITWKMERAKDDISWLIDKDNY